MDQDAARRTAAQLARPSGDGGIAITTSMNTTNAFVTERALEALELRSGDAWLEIGPGNACLSADAVTSLGSTGRYLGFEYNEEIATIARDTLAGCDADVEVRSGDFVDHGFEVGAFDALMGVNVVYFFDDIDAMVARCASWLRPGGRLVFGIRSIRSLGALPISAHGFNLRPVDDYFIALHAAGFEAVGATFHDEGTTTLGDDVIAVDSIVISAALS